MRELDDEYKKEIQEFADNFMNTVLESKPTNNQCFVICYPLSIHLSNHYNIQSTIKGAFYKNEAMPKREPHYWLTFDDYEEIIFDPTVDQFDKNKQKPFFDIEKKNYQDTAGDYKYVDWLKSIRNNWISQTDSYDLICTCLLAARIVIPETEQLKDEGIPEPFNYGGYKEDIDQIIKANYTSNKELMKRFGFLE